MMMDSDEGCLSAVDDIVEMVHILYSQRGAVGEDFQHSAFTY